MEIRNSLFKLKPIKTGENHSTSSSKLYTKKITESINDLLTANNALFKKRTKYELMYEAFYISNLFYEMTQTNYHLKDTFFYLINLDWFQKWKKYVNYDFFTNTKNFQKFISINSLPFRPTYINNESYMNYINKNTKNKISDFFDKFFLSDNATLYPGYINNKKFLLDKYQNSTYLYNKNRENNFNVVDNIKYNKDYIWVTEDIWKYFYCIYGGFEIRRRNLNINKKYYELYLNNNESFDNEKNIILEKNFMTFNLIVFNYNKNYTYKIDPPKYLFVEHYATILDLKKKIKNIFLFLSKYNLEEIHLFYLNQNMNLNSFADYVQSHSNIKGEMVFPGINLDFFDQNLPLEFIQERHFKINNNNNNIKNYLVLEIPFLFWENKKKIYLFKHEINYRQNELMEIVDYKINKSFYDKIELEPKEENNIFVINEKLFLIKKYFYQKYYINKIYQCPKIELNIHLKKIIDNFNEEQINKMFEAEINELRNNIDLIFDKTYLAENISGLYLSEFDTNNKNNENKILLNKKRERVNNTDNDYILLDKDCDSDEISWYSCGFCNKTLNQKFVVCKFCMRKKYCDYFCRTNDVEKHLKHCGK